MVKSTYQDMTRKRSRYYPAVANAIARNYSKLRSMCWHSDTDGYGGISYEDIFQDTVMFVIGDDKAAACKSDDDLIEWFQYRYNMIQFRTIQDYKQSKSIYANYQQAEKDKED